nr:membrane glycoprotein E68 [Elephant endotheliotropic herpesvirus 1A]
MGGGNQYTYIVSMVSFLSVLGICDMGNFCDQDDEKRFEIPTLSRFDDNITITVTLESNGNYMLTCNGSVIYDTHLKNSKVNVTTNTTHFTLLTSCTEAVCNYALQTERTEKTEIYCQYFNVSNCPSHFPSEHLAQNSCCERTYVMFTSTSFVIIIFYLFF